MRKKTPGFYRPLGRDAAFRRRQRQKPKRSASSGDGNTQSISASLKDELLLIGFLVLFVGIISTDTYYAAFGVRYQFLSLPSFHIVYRGLTVLRDAPYLLLPYGLVVIYFWLDRDIDQRAMNFGSQRWRTLLSYVVILAMLAVTYPLARRAGRSVAELDLHETTSTLPEVVYLGIDEDANQDQEISDTLVDDQTSYRLLLIQSDYVVIFKPIKAGAPNYFPNIKWIEKGDLKVIETNRYGIEFNR